MAAVAKDGAVRNGKGKHEKGMVDHFDGTYTAPIGKSYVCWIRIQNSVGIRALLI